MKFEVEITRNNVTPAQFLAQVRFTVDKKGGQMLRSDLDLDYFRRGDDLNFDTTHDGMHEKSVSRPYEMQTFVRHEDGTRYNEICEFEFGFDGKTGTGYYYLLNEEPAQNATEGENTATDTQQPTEAENASESVRTPENASTAPKHRYINQCTEERTDRASVALTWHRNGDRVQVDTLNPSGSLRTSNVIEGAKVETERERFDREEGRERCKRLAEEVNAYAEGNIYRCPECGEVVEMPDDVGDKFKCYHCGKVAEVVEFEQLSIYDYMDDILDIDFTVNRYKEYQSCSICIGWGGPNIYIDTADAYIKLYWGSTREQYPIRYETRDQIDEWAEEYYNCL